MDGIARAANGQPVAVAVGKQTCTVPKCAAHFRPCLGSDDRLPFSSSTSAIRPITPFGRICRNQTFPSFACLLESPLTGSLPNPRDVPGEAPVDGL